GMLQLLNLLACFRIPNTGKLVLCRRDDPRAIRAEGGGEEPLLPIKRDERLAGLGIPNDGGVIGGGDDAVSLWVERGGGHCAQIALESALAARDRSEERARPGIPDPGGLVSTGGDNARAVGAERHFVDKVFMVHRNEGRRRSIPDAGGFVV